MCCDPKRSVGNERRSVHAERIMTELRLSESFGGHRPPQQDHSVLYRFPFTVGVSLSAREKDKNDDK